ncbi:hypothetical protein NDU88_000340 [Pleurodeles waltl]|uniref:Uncharacterized protein n=1 Tax=Pleurodeles waltl TaxID=8319 RepID=A0AAV7L698_PLEWA|nr:hypothetical protein NDU88_000340 [Pleurodeles waltl]
MENIQTQAGRRTPPPSDALVHAGTRRGGHRQEQRGAGTDPGYGVFINREPPLEPEQPPLSARLPDTAPARPGMPAPDSPGRQQEQTTGLRAKTSQSGPLLKKKACRWYKRLEESPARLS